MRIGGAGKERERRRERESSIHRFTRQMVAMVRALPGWRQELLELGVWDERGRVWTRKTVTGLGWAPVGFLGYRKAAFKVNEMFPFHSRVQPVWIVSPASTARKFNFRSASLKMIHCSGRPTNTVWHRVEFFCFNWKAERHTHTHTRSLRHSYQFS